MNFPGESRAMEPTVSLEEGVPDPGHMGWVGSVLRGQTPTSLRVLSAGGSWVPATTQPPREKDLVCLLWRWRRRRRARRGPNTLQGGPPPLWGSHEAKRAYADGEFRVRKLYHRAGTVTHGPGPPRLAVGPEFHSLALGRPRPQLKCKRVTWRCLEGPSGTSASCHHY